MTNWSYLSWKIGNNQTELGTDKKSLQRKIVHNTKTPFFSASNTMKMNAYITEFFVLCTTKKSKDTMYNKHYRHEHSSLLIMREVSGSTPNRVHHQDLQSVGLI